MTNLDQYPTPMTDEFHRTTLPTFPMWHDFSRALERQNAALRAALSRAVSNPPAEMPSPAAEASPLCRKGNTVWQQHGDGPDGVCTQCGAPAVKITIDPARLSREKANQQKQQQ